jgi:hypothetical protein
MAAMPDGNGLAPASVSILSGAQQPQHPGDSCSLRSRIDWPAAASTGGLFVPPRVARAEMFQHEHAQR